MRYAVRQILDKDVFADEDGDYGSESEAVMAYLWGMCVETGDNAACVV